METKTISILGCGWYGKALAKALANDGYVVKTATRKAEKLAELTQLGTTAFLIDLADQNVLKTSDFFNTDVLFISMPPSRTAEQTSYLTQIKWIAEVIAFKVKQVILISSTGVYADDNWIVDESIPANAASGNGKIMIDAEQYLQQQTGFTTTIIRFAGLIGPDRNLAKHFTGKTGIANGLAPINFIHLTDCIGLSKAIITQKAFGNLYHGVSPEHPTRQDFYTKACVAQGWEKPSFIAEKTNWKQIESKNVPEVLAYRYVFDNWDKYIAAN